MVSGGSVTIHAPVPRVIEAFLGPGASRPHPGCVLREGHTGLFVQPAGETHCLLHLVAADASDAAAWRLEVERLKPILESQAPGRTASAAARWVPVARSDDLAARHIFHTALDGQELALWRDESGLANVWENRCPHRGVRLTIGTHLGSELRCRFHGWRFASGSGQCVSLPARVETYPCVERHGLVWTNLAGAPEDIPALADADWRPLRAVFVEAPLAAVAAHLPQTAGLVLFLQPVDPRRTVIHGLSADPAATLRRYDDLLTGLRDRIESEAP
jgi:nitrite reductase/ring-hydroxylating ferredoxin subunit